MLRQLVSAALSLLRQPEPAPEPTAVELRQRAVEEWDGRFTPVLNPEELEYWRATVRERIDARKRSAPDQ